MNMNPTIENAQRIWEIFKIIIELGEQFRKDSEEVEQANALLKLLRRMAAKESATFDIKEFNTVLPHANLNWDVHNVDVRDDASFIIDFRPDPAVREPKRIVVNMGLLKQLPYIPIIVVSGRDAHEIDTQRPVTAKTIVDWMQKQEDELTMAYGRRERERIGR